MMRTIAAVAVGALALASPSLAQEAYPANKVAKTLLRMSNSGRPRRAAYLSGHIIGLSNGRSCLYLLFLLRILPTFRATF